MGAARTLVVWCPDWPVVAAGGTDRPLAVLSRGTVLACSAPARAAGVERGHRRRQAQARCPGLEVVEHDPGADARAFEPVVAAVETFTPTVEVVRAGVCALPTRGPSRYFGGDDRLAARVAVAVDAVLAGRAGDGAGGAGPPRCRVGVADGRFAAAQAARRGLLVPRGAGAAFLAPLPVAALEEARAFAGGDGELAGLVDLLGRLGIRTLGDLAALPARAVVARFGPLGTAAHRLARGLDERPLAARRPPPDLAAEAELDPPADRVDAAAFVARGLAEQLHDALAARGLAAARVAIEAEAEDGTTFRRLWRLDGVAGATGAGGVAGALAQRARWQLESWLAAGEGGPLLRLRLVPDEVRPDRGRQQGFWGGDRAAADRVAGALARIQGRLGAEAVAVALPAGGRGPADQHRLVPWGDPAPPGPPPGPPAPWPGRVPDPPPATVHPAPRPVEVVGLGGEAVGVEGRGLPTAELARLSVEGGRWVDVAGWAGPWPLDERWWDPDGHRRRARWQVVTAEGEAHLLALEGGRWWLEATYD